jgi:hypothetical protein
MGVGGPGVRLKKGFIAVLTKPTECVFGAM